MLLSCEHCNYITEWFRILSNDFGSMKFKSCQRYYKYIMGETVYKSALIQAQTL